MISRCPRNCPRVAVRGSQPMCRLPNAKGKPTGQAARTTTDNQRSRDASKIETPPLVRVGLTRLLGLLHARVTFGATASTASHWRAARRACNCFRSFESKNNVEHHSQNECDVGKSKFGVCKSDVFCKRDVHVCEHRNNENAEQKRRSASNVVISLHHSDTEPSDEYAGKRWKCYAQSGYAEGARRLKRGSH